MKRIFNEKWPESLKSLVSNLSDYEYEALIKQMSGTSTHDQQESDHLLASTYATDIEIEQAIKSWAMQSSK